MKVLMILSKEILTDDRVYREAKALVEAGHEVAIIAWDRCGEYERESEIDGIKIFRIHNEGLMKILPNNLFRNPLWWKMAYRKGLDIYKSGFRFNVVHCHDLDTLLSGVWLKRKLKVRLIYDAHEIFGYMISRDKPSVVVKSAFWIEKSLVKYVDYIITVSEILENYFKSFAGKPVTVVMNCKNLVSKKYIPPNNDVFTVCYIGVLHKNRMFPELVDIIGNIEGVKLVIAGKKENLYDEVKKRSERYENIEFLGAIPFSDVIPETLKSDVVINMINPNDLNDRISLPNKLFEALVCGRPIITTKGTYVGELAEKLRCGIAIDYDGESVKKAVELLRDNQNLREELGKNAFKAAKERYNWDEEKRNLLKVYRELKD